LAKALDKYKFFFFSYLKPGIFAASISRPACLPWQLACVLAGRLSPALRFGSIGAMPEGWEFSQI
jgi:hypothetical protein